MGVCGDEPWVGSGEFMKKIVCDIETYSDVDLLKCGVYKYASSENFEILLFSYSVDGSEVQTVDVASGEKIPDDILKALIDENIEKWAYNVNFERVCLSAFLRRNYPELLREYDTYSIPEDSVSGFLAPSSWYCSQLAAIYLGLPLSLASVGEVLKIEEQKMTEGKRLIDYFSKPARNGTRHLPSDAPDKWETYKAYNKRDVEAEMAIDRKVERFPVPQSVWDEYHLSEEINDRGIQLDMDFVNRAITADEQSRTELTARLKELTGLENPNSVAQMKQWLADNGVETESLGKADVQELLKAGGLSPEIEEVLLLRQQSAKSSVKKYTAMQNAVGKDGRARGMFFFYGANRTGRFAGRLIQLQNLPQNHITDLAEARALVKSGDFGALELLYDNIPDTLSQLVRTAFVPKQGMKFIVADFSAIEARVIAWLAGEQWRMNAFANGEDIYCASASKMFGVPVVKHGVNGHLRQKGKVAELACGYGGSVGAMKAMGGSDLGLSDEELKQIVTDWRTASPNIVKLWWDVDNAVKKAVRKKEITATHGLQFSYQSGILFIRLPSGRSLAYVKPRIEENAFGGESITYEGVGATKKWERIESYGPKFVENCLAKGTLVITDCGLIPIEKITDDMKIWDGVEWVSHDGLIVQGRKDTINVDGIRMTPEHKILTKKGWIECGKAEGFNWSDVSLPDRSSKGRGQQAGENAVALQMCLWESDCCFSKKSKSGEIPTKILWVHEKRINQQGKYNAWNEPSSCLGCLAFDETALYRLESSCISQLWWQRDFCVSALDGKFRELLVGYGRNVAERTGHRQDRQQQGVQPRKLSLGNQKAEQQKQTKQSNGNNLIRKDDTLGTFRKDWDWSNNTTLSPESWMESRIVIDRTRFQEYVYDIRNCGSRHRFAVWNGKRACIVSNCVQGIARDLLMNSMMALRSCFIVAHIHDELIIEADKRMSLEVLCEQMARVPDWAEGLLLRADGYECEFYRKD